MTDLALGTWVITALGGLFLLAIWLIEYDPDFQTAAATRLPIPVISSHVLLAVGGLVVWVMYLLTDMDILAWITLADLAVVVTLGLIMAVRWIGVYRTRITYPAGAYKSMAGVGMGASGGGAAREGLGYGGGAGADLAVPPERHFPVTVVIAHGIFAAVTVTLVLLTTLGVGGS
jgi:hypothetical protein